jgi:energy-coupling factor transport system permease protein
MASHDALRHVSIGRYVPGASAIHRLDPRVKLGAVALLAVAMVLATTYTTTAVLALTVVGLVLLSGLPARYTFAAVRPMAPFLAVLAIFQLLFAPVGEAATVLLRWGPLTVTPDSLRSVIVSIVRLVNLVVLTGLLTSTTSPSGMTHGIDLLLRPLTAIGLPGHELALVATIALNFVPILGEQMESIVLAQTSRGVRHDDPNRWNLVRNARRAAGLVVPLFVDAFRRVEEMVTAMMARCYRGGRGRTHYVELAMRPADYVALAAAGTSLLLVVLSQRMPLP